MGKSNSPPPQKDFAAQLFEGFEGWGGGGGMVGQKSLYRGGKGVGGSYVLVCFEHLN